MEQQLFKTLPYKTIAEVTNESVSYIQARKDRTRKNILHSKRPLAEIQRKFEIHPAGGIVQN